jgi:hypothetical protein
VIGHTSPKTDTPNSKFYLIQTLFFPSTTKFPKIEAKETMRDGIACRVALSSYRHAFNPSCRLYWRAIGPRFHSHHGTAFSTSSRALAAATPANEKEIDIGIIGGGISGLCTAFYLLAWHQRAFMGRPPKITIYEASKRVGGWIQTTRVGKGENQWNFEHGPRTLRLRPDSMILQLVSKLALPGHH